jgi:uncharacterized MnhB-related membrane protein
MTAVQPTGVAGPRASLWLLALAVVVVVVLLGLTRVADPFHGDHALFLRYATAIDRGDVLYVDVWDNKQPGIFWFYLVGGRLFGYSEVGVRLFELAYQAAFAVVLVVALRGWLRAWWLAVLAPIATIGAYYAMTGPRHLTQPEAIVAFPLFLALWLAAAPRATVRGRRLAWFGAGVCAALVIAIKLVFAPIVAIGWLAALWTAESDDAARRSMLDRVLPSVAGLALVVGVVVGLSAVQGALPAFTWTSLVYPAIASAEVPLAAFSRLAGSLAWYALAGAPWLVLALAAGVRWRGRRQEWLAVQMLVWLVVGAAVILVQKFSWWEYHFVLFMVPVGLLAVRGADGLIAAVRPSARGLVSVVLVLVLFATPVAVTVARVWRAGFEPVGILGSLGDEATVREYQRRRSPTYESIWQSTAFLRGSDALPGPIYVVGDPLYLQASGREQAIPTHGWSWEMLLQSQWDALATELSDAAPAYVFLDDDLAAMVADRSPATLVWLARDYQRLTADPDGVWFERRAP